MKKQKELEIITDYGIAVVRLTESKTKISITLEKGLDGMDLPENDKVEIYLDVQDALLIHILEDINDILSSKIEEKDTTDIILKPKEYPLIQLIDFGDKSKTEDLTKTILNHGRVSVILNNKAKITLCRPILSFENKSCDFKNSRMEVEKNYWIEKKDDCRKTGIEKVAAFMLDNLFN